MNRSKFLFLAGVVMTGAIAGGLLSGCATDAPPPLPLSGSAGNGISIVTGTGDTVVASAPVQTALAQVRRTLMARGFVILMCSRLIDAGRDDLCLVVATDASSFAHDLNVVVPDAAGAKQIAFGRLAGREVMLACGRDEAGLVAALNEIGRNVAQAADPHTALRPAPIVPVLAPGAIPPKS